MESVQPRDRIRAAVTLDLHDTDSPDDIRYAADWLAQAGIAATVFVPSEMFRMRQYAECLREMSARGHVMGSHTHKHDWTEIAALMAGGPARLGFLENSKARYEDFFGLAPLVFRSPAWCGLGPAALDALQALGYRVDSSATPQRPSLLSSMPFQGGWLTSPRGPYYIRPRPLLVPAGSPTFLTLRRTLSLGFLRLLLAEARLFPDRVVVLQLHAEDFNPRSVRPCGTGRALRPGDFLPRRKGGFGFKELLRERDRDRISDTAHAIVRSLLARNCLTLTELADEIAPGPAPGGDRAHA